MKRVLLLACDAVEVLEAAAFFDVLGWASEYGDEPVEVTTMGPATAVDVAFALLGDLAGAETVARVRRLMGFAAGRSAGASRA